MGDDRTPEQKAADFDALSESLRRASLDLSEAVSVLSADYAASGMAKNPFEWLRSIERCEKDSLIVAEKFAALRIAVLNEPFK